MSLKRVSKKLVRDLSDIDAAIIVCNAYDPQLATLAVFYNAVEDLSHFTVLNKTDMVGGEEVLELMKTLPGEVIPASLIKGRGVPEIEFRLNQWVNAKKIAVLGIFNSGKTSLINALTGEHNLVDDIPGTTLIFSEHKYKGMILLDSIGQLIDVSKPLMFSVDLMGCETIVDKLRTVLHADSEAIIASICSALPDLVLAVDLIITQVKNGGKVVLCGAGASALVAMEMAGQAQETGLPVMVFTNDYGSMQPITFAKGIGEDEGALAEYINRAVNVDDIIIGISASGGTGFVFTAMDLAQQKGAKTIAITENRDTPMGKVADIIIKSEGKPEGCSSSKVQVAHLAIGHALMITVADERGVDAEKSIGYMMRQVIRNKKMGIK